MTTNTQTVVIQHEGIPIEVDLCDLLQTMRLVETTEKPEGNDMRVMPPADGRDVLMSDDPSYHSDGVSEYSSSSSNSNSDESYGCAYLQAIRVQLDKLPTTGGEYLDTIFTHREILSAFPSAHPHCARGFSDLAYSLEQRAWRADRDADTEAVAAFRHEAWMIAASSAGTAKQMFEPSSGGQSSVVCIMPVM